MSTKAQNEDLKNMAVLCTFKTKIERQNLQIWKTGESNASDHFQIKTRVPNPSQKPPGSSKILNKDFKNMDFLCTCKIKIEYKYFEHWCIRDQWLYPNQDADAKPQSGTSIILQSPISGLTGHGCSLHLENQVRESKFRSWVYQRPVTLYKLRSRC